jgi:protocatechuate 3,4-dioxygenase beta subunit
MIAVLVLAASITTQVAATTQGQRGAPPRDQQPAQKGTATVRGRVLAGDTGKPLRRARVNLLRAGDSQMTSTDADGRYEFTELAAGAYRMRVSRSGYLTLQYGQRRPLEQGKPLEVRDKETIDAGDFTLPRMSVITGRISDELGEPLEGVTVLALRSRYWEGRRQLIPTGQGLVFTDDAGQFRVLGLAPGTYYVSATTRETWAVNQGGTRIVMGYAPTYFPGTTLMSEAKRITVGLGKEIINTDFSMVTGRAATISGTAFDSHGRPFPRVNLSEEVRGENFARFGGNKSATPAADGTFTIRDVPPGEYKLTTGTQRGAEHPEAAIVPVSVDGVDINGVALLGSGGGSITGRVLTDTGETPSIPRLRVTIGLPLTGQPEPMLLGAFGDPGASQVGDDGSFSIKGVFGRSRIRVVLPDDWMVKSITHDGRDLTDAPIELKSGETLSNVQIVLTNKVTIIDGALTDDKDRPTADGTVIVFAEDAARWAADSRSVRTARPDQQGHFQMKGLPPGAYLAVAVDYVEDGMWNDPEFLESLRARAHKISVADAATASVSLKLIAQP